MSTIATMNVRTSLDGAGRTEASLEAHGVLAERRLVAGLGVDVESRQRAARWSTGGPARPVLAVSLAHHR